MRNTKSQQLPAQADDGHLSVEEAEALIARLRRIDALHTEALTAIADAEILLDDALLACPTLDGAGAGAEEGVTLHALRRIA